MKRKFKFGKIDVEDKGKKLNLVEVEMEYRKDGNKKVFSASGSVWDSRHYDTIMSGQCLDEIAIYVKDPVFLEIYRLWKLYHLNDMHPECEHQAALGWNEKVKKKVFIYNWTIDTKASSVKKSIEKDILKDVKLGKTIVPSKEQSFYVGLPYGVKTYTEFLPKVLRELYRPSTYEPVKVTTLGWLKESEHPEGLLCKPCPVCGYKYGTSWNYFPIPEEDEKIILNLLKMEDIKNV